MANVKWIKLSVEMFDDEKIEFIQGLPEGDSILVIWVRLLVLAGKCNADGYIYLTEQIPYTEDSLAYKFRKPASIIKLSLQTFQKLRMIEINEKGILLLNWSKHQNMEGLEKIKQREQAKIRKRKQREKKKLIQGVVKEESNLENQKSRDCHSDVKRDPSYIEEEKEEDIDIELEKKVEIEEHIEREKEVEAETEEDEEIEVKKHNLVKQVENENISSSPAAKNFSDVVKVFNNNIHMITPLESEKIKDWLIEMEPEVIIKAIEEAVYYNKRSMGYINAVLNSWLNNNFKNIQAVNAHLRDRALSKRGDKGGSSRENNETSISELYDFSKYGG